jgi:hypothetical protein
MSAESTPGVRFRQARRFDGGGRAWGDPLWSLCLPWRQRQGGLGWQPVRHVGNHGFLVHASP